MNIEVISAKNVTRYIGEPDVLNMDVLFNHLEGFVQFSAKKDDSEIHGRELYVRAVFGEFGTITELELPAPSEEMQREILANKLQQASISIAPLEDAEKLGIISEAEREQLTAWQRYRVALYRLPQSEGWPTEVTWPDAPQ